jgi:glycosyltransferase involved in cell wall biosynthesis
MKVLIVHNAYQNPGGEDVVFDQERRLLEREGHRVSVYRRSNWEMDHAVGLTRLMLVPNTVWNSRSRQEISKLLSQERPDVVHVHNTFIMISPSIFSACREAGVPVVQTLHNYRLFCPAALFFRKGKVCEECLQHSLWRGIRYGCYRDSSAETAVVALMLAVNRSRGTWTEGVDRFVTLTESSRQKFVAAGLPAEKVGVKPNFVHPDPGARAEGGDYAAFVGRLSPEKGVMTLLAAWSQLRTPIPLSILGGGPQQEELQVRADALHLAGVRFEGQVKRELTIAAIKGARFLVFPSEWYEIFPVTIAEAFACGTPIICSRLGSMQELVEDGRTGLHFTPGDPEDLARKVEWAWAHPEKMWKMGKEARREYEAKYTAEKNYPMLIETYRAAMAARG